MIRIFRVLRNGFAKIISPQNRRLQEMAEKIEKMKETIDRTTPRSAAILMIASAIPTFLFIDTVLNNEYNTSEFLFGANFALHYYYLKNLILYGCGAYLMKLGFFNPSSQYTISTSKSVRFALIPLIGSVIGLCLPPSDYKLSILPAVVVDLITMTIELQMTNVGSMPFWFYAYRHYIRFYDWLAFIVLYFALKRYRARRISNPEEFAKLSSTESSFHPSMQ